MAEQRPGGNYYDDQFAARISRISTGNASPPRAPGSGGGGKAGCGGTAILFVVLGVIRVLASGCGSSSRNSPPTYPSVPPSTYSAPQRDQFKEIQVKDMTEQQRRDEEERRRPREAIERNRTRPRDTGPDFNPGRAFEQAQKDRPRPQTKGDPQKQDKGHGLD